MSKLTKSGIRDVSVHIRMEQHADHYYRKASLKKTQFYYQIFIYLLLIISARKARSPRNMITRRRRKADWANNYVMYAFIGNLQMFWEDSNLTLLCYPVPNLTWPTVLKKQEINLRDKTMDNKLVYNISKCNNSYFSYRIINGFPRI